MSETPDERAWRRDRRAAVRRHHPDVGGDPVALQAALAEVDRRHGRGAASTSTAAPRRVVVVRRSPLSQLVRGIREVRRRIPTGWPGHRTGRDLD
ncbi:hypothetical protein [Nocardioides sp. CFH 31398]|uniref:hypothetical protein n=1 Tax=Nocardioides sp. CFH 31398 TaxID=2919579 RepID=UPI001F059C89|nr:hypothetical protein [Nocardioides sp. CFH 31398]MCH1865462.1 hypothetical protein [Nocardioides sp. CFH 31398]